MTEIAMVGAMGRSAERRRSAAYRSGADEAPAWVGHVRSWCLVQQAVDVDQLEGFDLIVVTDPVGARADWLTDDLVGALQALDIRLAAHVPLVRPLGSATRPVAVTPSGLRKASWYVEAVDRIRAAMTGPWDGCYLDDVTDALAFPDGAPAVLELVGIARTISRGGIVIIQSVDLPVIAQAADLVGVSQPLGLADPQGDA